MQPFPHHYAATATASPEGDIPVDSPGVDRLITAAPAEFGGPGDLWSPETMLVGAVANCFILTFRAIASASKLPWMSLECHVDGVLERVDRVTKFTEMKVRARLGIPAGADADKAMRLLEKAEQVCLITNSLTAETHLEASIDVVEGTVS